MRLRHLRCLLTVYENTHYIRRYILGDHLEVVKIREFLTRLDDEGDRELSAAEACELLEMIPPENTLDICVSIREHFPDSSLIELFDFLGKQGLITLQIFKQMHAGRSSILMEICKSLERANCLNASCLQLLVSEEKFHSRILDIIRQIGQLNISLDETSFKKIFDSQNLVLYKLHEMLGILLEAKCPLDTDTLDMLLSQDYKFFAEKNNSLDKLQKHHLLDASSFHDVLTHDRSGCLAVCSDMFRILDNQSLLQQNRQLVMEIMNNDQKIFRFIMIFDYLAKYNLLSQKSLDDCLNITRKKSNSITSADNIFYLFKLLDINDFVIDKERLDSIFQMRDKNTGRLYLMVERLAELKLLNEQSFEQAFQRVTTKLPTVTESSMQKTSRRQSGLPRSEIVLDNNLHLFKEYNKTHQYQGGGIGKIKKGYASVDANEPVLAIKQMRVHAVEPQKAKRAAKYNRLLGRNAFYYTEKTWKRNRTCVVADWQAGKSLGEHAPSDILQLSQENRLQCFITALQDLDVLHSHYRIHGNIKPNNFILDLQSRKMKLIDFDSTHKKSWDFPGKAFETYTRKYLDPWYSTDNFARDIYAMGFVVMQLFPDIYQLSFTGDTPLISLTKTHFTPSEQAIIDLVDCLMNKNFSKRCTTQDAIIYCHKIHGPFGKYLDEHMVREIADQTIHRSTVTVEDVLRDTKRFMPFMP